MRMTIVTWRIGWQAHRHYYFCFKKVLKPMAAEQHKARSHLLQLLYLEGWPWFVSQFYCVNMTFLVQLFVYDIRILTILSPYLVYQSFRSSPASGNLAAAAEAAALAVVRPVEAKYPALLFKQQLAAYVEKMFGMVRDNLKRELSTLLSLCIQVPCWILSILMLWWMFLFALWW